MLLSVWLFPWKSNGATLFLKAGEEAAGSKAVNFLLSGEDCSDMVCGQTQTVGQATRLGGFKHPHDI